MLIRLDPASATPVYEQIVDAIMGGIGRGDLTVGARLPTVRQLAADLGVATNTVAKAYRQLEQDGQVVTAGRNGTVVQARPQPAGADDEVAAAAVLLARAAQRQGLDLATALGQVRQAW